MTRRGRAFPVRAHLGRPIVTPAASVPDAPTGLIATQGNGQVALSWTAPGNNGGATITDYTVQYQAQILQDEFPGSVINSTNWTVYNRCGDLVNSELQGMIPANVRVSGGSLFIDTKFEDVTIGDSLNAPATFHYTSGHIAQASQPFLYGSVEVRAKICGGTGTWPVIWMLDYTEQPHQPNSANEPGTPGWVPFAEIDIAEFLGGNRTLMNCQIHYDPGSGRVDPGGNVTIPYDATTRFMVYRLDWTAGSAIFSVDPEDGGGFQVVQTITGAGNVPNVPMYLTISVAVGGAGGAPNSATYPVTTEVDYVRVTPWVTFSHGASASTSITVTGLTNGIQYNFRVAAVNSAGTGAWSSTATPPTTGKRTSVLTAVRRGSMR